MFLFTSVVPHSMVLARLRNMPRTSNGNESAHRSTVRPSGSLFHANASQPITSTAMSWMRWLSDPWWTLPIDAAGPGVPPARMVARTRSFVHARMRSSL